jgi:hypothetical protein
VSAIKVDEAELLAVLGENGEHWLQGAWERDSGVCLHGAIRRCQPVPGDAFLIEQVAQRQGWGTDWNDDEDTTWEQVRDRLARVEVTDADLAATFGPQWAQIVALVRRAAVLTEDEADRLAAARGASRAAAWAASRAAAWAASRGASRAAAWAASRGASRAASRDAARAAAVDAAWDAAVALSARDLITPDDFTQQHYDVLTGPWREVIGPVHPDDQ